MDFIFDIEIDRKACISPFSLESSDCPDCLGQTFALLPCIVESTEKKLTIDPERSKKAWDKELHGEDLKLNPDNCRKKNRDICLTCLNTMFEHENPCTIMR